MMTAVPAITDIERHPGSSGRVTPTGGPPPTYLRGDCGDFRCHESTSRKASESPATFTIFRPRGTLLIIGLAL